MAVGLIKISIVISNPINIFSMLSPIVADFTNYLSKVFHKFILLLYVKFKIDEFKYRNEKTCSPLLFCKLGTIKYL